MLTIFWHCGFRHFSFKNAPDRSSGNEPSIVLIENLGSRREIERLKGLAMLIRSQMHGVRGDAARAVRASALPAASLPTLLIGGLLLICP
jgi:hypothetical protein